MVEDRGRSQLQRPPTTVGEAASYLLFSLLAMTSGILGAARVLPSTLAIVLFATFALLWMGSRVYWVRRTRRNPKDRE